MKLYTLIALTIFSIHFGSFASGEESSTTVEIKPGGAVSAFSEEDGFKLSQDAIANLGISFLTLKGDGPWKVPTESLIKIKHSTGVYRRYNDWITMVLVKVVQQNKDFALIKSVDLLALDDVAVSGAAFLRMTDADLNSDTVDSCAH